MVSTALAQRSVAPDAVAESMSTCFLIEYAGISVPALLAGISISWFGIQSVTDVFVGSIILLSVAFLVKNHRIVSQSAVG